MIHQEIESRVTTLILRHISHRVSVSARACVCVNVCACISGVCVCVSGVCVNACVCVCVSHITHLRDAVVN